MTEWGIRRYLVTGLLALAVLLAGFGGWAVMAQITGAVIISGQVAVAQNRQIVQHPFGGIVSTVLIAEGDLVAKGDLLIRLDPSDLRSELAVIEGQLFELLAQRARLEAERDEAAQMIFDPALTAARQPIVAALMDDQQRLFAARSDSNRQSVDRLTLQQTQIASKLTGLTAQQAAVVTQQELIIQELADLQSLLARGLAQAGPVLALQREHARLEGRHGELTADAAEATARMTEIDIQILGLAAARREEAIALLHDLRASQFDLSERRQTLLRQLDRLEIRAPTSGVVHDLQVFGPRAVIRAADTLLYLIPQDQPLVITTKIRPSDIDQIFAGQDVRLRFTAFDQRRSPELAGRVVRVSADTFRDETTGLPFYRAELRLNPGETDSLPSGMTLIPGMPVDAFARAEPRSPLDYLLKPLTDYFTRAFRDR
ncbi:MAG: HlyD family type I secretion periplasmic adaptor subunit [Loktanella sp.]|nr:HlyD family type I secretion periplasmic adaptor subunit [Loktanella sp.]